MKIPRLLLALALGVQSLLPAVAAETAAAVIARAREFIGGDAALKKVQSLQFVGTHEIAVEGGDVKAENRAFRSKIEFVFQKPMQYLMVRSDEKGRETVALSDYDCWVLFEEFADPSKTRLRVESPPRIRSLQANAFDSLNFFAGVEARGGTVSVQREDVLDGTPVVRLSMVHPGNVEIIRVFDKKSGRLVLTEMDGGFEIREEGEQWVNGVRFPTKVVSTTKRGGVTQRSIITIESLKVNEKVDPARFVMPDPNKL